jgi:hypothetical protein
MTSFATTTSGFATERAGGERAPRVTTTDRSSHAPCLGLALAVSGIVWASLGSAVLFLLA